MNEALLILSAICDVTHRWRRSGSGDVRIGDSQLGVSSGCSRLWDRLSVRRVVTEHGPEHVQTAPREREDGLGMSFAFSSLAVVVDLGCWVVANTELGGEVAGPE